MEPYQPSPYEARFPLREKCFPQRLRESYNGQRERCTVGFPTHSERILPFGAAWASAFGVGLSENPCALKQRVAWAFCGPLLVSSTGDAGCSENVPGMSQCSLSEPRLRMLLAADSRTVVMKVDIRMGMCNNSPAKASCSENERRSRVLLTPSLLRYVDRGGGTLRRAARSKAEAQSCRGIPRGTFFNFLFRGGGGEVHRHRVGKILGRCPLESRSGLQ